MTVVSLAERLGYTPDDHLLVVNCDDLGSSHAANVGIERALGDGIATTTTLMAPCAWAVDAAARCVGFDVGVHLTLNAEWDTCRWGPLTKAESLLDGQGCLPRTIFEVWENADPRDVREECRAQIHRALDLGFDVTHLDSHMGTLQLGADWFEIYLDLAVEFDLPIRLSGPDTEALLGFEFRGPATDAGIVFPDNFVFVPGVGTREAVEAFGAWPPGVTEMYVHPAIDTPELRGFAPDWEGRVDDLRLVTEDGSFRTRLESEGVHLIGYRELREVQRDT